MTRKTKFLKYEIIHFSNDENHNRACLFKCPKCTLKTSVNKLRDHLFNNHGY